MTYYSIRTSKTGFTLVELLVVIAIIGILVALLLPAVQSAREAARRSQCKNQLKQMALSCLLHEDTQGFFPSGGWGTRFVADPNRGYGKDQPGSWYYSVFAFLEENALRDLGKGTVEGSADYVQAITQLLQTPVKTFNCPSRRNIALGTHESNRLASEHSFVDGLQVAKGDYAANSGDSAFHATVGNNGKMPGAEDLSEADTADWANTRDEYLSATSRNPFYQSGVIYFRSETTFAKISDGSSKTYLIGEKFVSPLAYDSNKAWNLSSSDERNASYGDNQSMYAGYEWDNQRVAAGTTWTPRERSTLYNAAYGRRGVAIEEFQPAMDNNDDLSKNYLAYGSAHPGSMNMSMCDGSVRSISYDINPQTHQFLANREDGQPINDSDL